MPVSPPDMYQCWQREEVPRSLGHRQQDRLFLFPLPLGAPGVWLSAGTREPQRIFPSLGSPCLWGVTAWSSPLSAGSLPRLSIDGSLSTFLGFLLFENKCFQLLSPLLFLFY